MYTDPWHEAMKHCCWLLAIDNNQSVWQAAIKNKVAVIEETCQPAYKWRGRGTDSDKILKHWVFSLLKGQTS